MQLLLSPGARGTGDRRSWRRGGDPGETGTPSQYQPRREVGAGPSLTVSTAELVQVTR